MAKEQKDPTSKPDIFTIDIHNHILPDDWPDLKKRYGYGGFLNIEHHSNCKARLWKDGDFFREVDANMWDPDTRLQDCDESQVDVQVLSTVPVMFNYWANPRDTLDLSKILNDHMASVVERYPHRFLGLATLPMQAPELAAKELERAVKELGLAGVEIASHINEWNLNNPKLYPFYEAAEELGAAIFVHPWDMMGKAEMPEYWLPWLVGMPAETSRAICSMIFGGIFERFPNLNVAFAHGGGSFPATIGRIEHGFNVRPDLCAKDNHVNPKEYLGRFYFDTLVHNPQMLDYIVNLVGADKVALGTDYPFPLGELDPGELIHRMDYEQHTKEWLLHKSALKWLNLSDKQLKALGFNANLTYG